MATAKAATIPGDLRALMAEVGPCWSRDITSHVRLMIERFDPVLAGAPKEGVAVTHDIAYGEDSRQQLDVYAGAITSPQPVAMFVHGGAFVDGQRNRSAEVYANVSYFFARHGVIGVNLEYRLAPAHRYPSGVQDIALAVDWVCREIARFGGDPGRIFLVGHSAGAAHAAGYAFDVSWWSKIGPPLAGLIVLSGRVRADNSAVNPNAWKVEAYYGTDARIYDACSPVTHVNAQSIPTMIAFAEYENPLLDVYCLELAHRLAVAKGRAPPLLRLAGHNHTSLIAHINTADERLGHEMLEFIRHT